MHANGVAVELDEPVSGPTPWSQALERQRGNAVHRLLIDIRPQVTDTVRQLQAKGGKLIYGSAAGPVAYLDFSSTLGLVLEVTGGSAGPRAER